ncbi:MAG: NAD(P)/FAD-dependent oxidoreductase [Blautia sp.]|nr:NAD(P)/FAD-dependent oxidoreductase [Blautia sp.]
MEKIVIVGAGPAGISAALYAARANMDPLVINNGIGALEKAEKIENYFGLEHPLSGQELFDRGIEQAKALGVRILETEVLGVGGYDTYEVRTTEGTIETESLILATGGKRKSPAIPGVKKLEGRGVSYCAICDAFFYRGKEVAVLGNSDFALHEAEELAPVVAGVTIYTNGAEPEFSKEHSIPVNTGKIQAIEGEELVEGIRLESDVTAQENGEAKASVIPVAGVFVAMGTAGSADIARQMGAEVNEKGQIKINENSETTIPGLYAAGDCTGGLLQVCKAVYEGAQAGIHAGQYVRERHKK